MAGVLGDVILVNGVPWPRARGRRGPLPAAAAQRLQRPPLPSSPSTRRRRRLAVRADRQRRRTARGAGGPRRQSTLAPAERSDVIVDFAATRSGTEVTLRQPARVGTHRARDAVRRRPDGARRRLRRVPARLTATSSALDPVQAAGARAALRLPADRRRPSVMWMINGEPFDPARDAPARGSATSRSGGSRPTCTIPCTCTWPVPGADAQRRRPPGRTTPAGRTPSTCAPARPAEIIMRFDGYPGRYVLPLPQPRARGHGDDGQLRGGLKAVRSAMFPPVRRRVLGRPRPMALWGGRVGAVGSARSCRADAGRDRPPEAGWSSDPDDRRLPGEHETERPEGDGESPEQAMRASTRLSRGRPPLTASCGVPVAGTGTGEQERAAEDGRGEGDHGDHRCAGAQGETRAAQAGDGQQRGGANPGQPGPLALQAFLSSEAGPADPKAPLPEGSTAD